MREAGLFPAEADRKKKAVSAWLRPRFVETAVGLALACAVGQRFVELLLGVVRRAAVGVAHADEGGALAGGIDFEMRDVAAVVGFVRAGVERAGRGGFEAGGDSLGSGKEFSEVWGRLP